MGILNPNSTNYQHPWEPNLSDLTLTMAYNNAGEPVLRTHVDGITLQGDVIVDKVKLWDGTNNMLFELPNNDGEAGQIAMPVEGYNYVYNGTTWDRMRGNTTDGVLTKITNSYLPISKDTNANSDTNRIYVNASGTVELGSTTLAALENITVSGTVSIDSLPEVEIKNDSGNPIPVSWVYGGGATLIPWEVQVSRGKIAGVTNLNISGYNDNVGTTFVPLWHMTTAYVYPASASTMRIWSDSASDTNVSVLITGLDANYAPITETITLTNGSTGVITTNQFLRINNLAVTRTPMNVGMIHCGNSAKTEHYCAIEAGAGRSQQTIYTVPAGYTFYLTQSNFYTNNTGNNVGLYRSYTVSPTGVVNIILTSPFPVNYNSRKVAPRAYTEKTDIQWQVSSKSGACEIGGQIEGFLIANSVA